MAEGVKRKIPWIYVMVMATVAIMSVLVVMLLLGSGESVGSISAAEWNAEYDQIYDNPDSVMRFPNYDDGDAVVIAGTITDMEVRHQNVTDISPIAYDYVILSVDGVQIEGLEWEYAITSLVAVGDHIEITFHIENWSISSYSGETISEWDYNTILPGSTLRKT